jgi:hypothetical protein
MSIVIDVTARTPTSVQGRKAWVEYDMAEGATIVGLVYAYVDNAGDICATVARIDPTQAAKLAPLQSPATVWTVLVNDALTKTAHEVLTRICGTEQGKAWVVATWRELSR